MRQVRKVVLAGVREDMHRHRAGDTSAPDRTCTGPRTGPAPAPGPDLHRPPGRTYTGSRARHIRRTGALDRFARLRTPVSGNS
ncbi:hypothetical protein GCM10017562_38650 [Streptomyces roseofulvus]